MRLLVDTHVLIWWLHDLPDRLDERQRGALRDAAKGKAPLSLSAISLWETAMMVERRRVSIAKTLDQLLSQIEAHPLLAILPLTATIAAESVRLGEDFHKDPADRIIVATARCHGLTLVTADERIRKWGKVNII
ncbi:MAG TPA: type II toxin-antitoxin system VapC family toxin [Bryobacteraceae bacterium]|nr:type II toxin-antitoxin system VapC family toxin [Bryobacteraceae bacterium]